MLIKNFLKDKGVGFWLYVLSAALMIISFILMIVTGNEKGDLTGGIIALSIIGILLQIVTLAIDFYNIGEMVATVLFICGLILFIDGRLEMIGLILNGVVTETIPLSFILMAVFGVLAIVLNCVVAFTGLKKRSVAPAKETK